MLCKCVLCGKFASSVTIHGDWLCGDCVKSLGGYLRWSKIRKMTASEIRATITEPIRAKILDHGGGVVGLKKGGVGRAVMGGFVAGGAGAIVGAGTGRRKMERNDYTVFKVWYSDGTSAIVKAAHSSREYEMYLNLLDD